MRRQAALFALLVWLVVGCSSGDPSRSPQTVTPSSTPTQTPAAAPWPTTVELLMGLTAAWGYQFGKQTDGLRPMALWVAPDMTGSIITYGDRDEPAEVLVGDNLGTGQKHITRVIAALTPGAEDWMTAFVQWSEGWEGSSLVGAAVRDGAAVVALYTRGPTRQGHLLWIRSLASLPPASESRCLTDEYYRQILAGLESDGVGDNAADLAISIRCVIPMKPASGG